MFRNIPLSYPPYAIFSLAYVRPPVLHRPGVLFALMMMTLMMTGLATRRDTARRGAARYRSAPCDQVISIFWRSKRCKNNGGDVEIDDDQSREKFCSSSLLISIISCRIIMHNNRKLKLYKIFELIISGNYFSDGKAVHYFNTNAVYELRLMVEMQLRS